MNICVLVGPLSGLGRQSREVVRTPYDGYMRMAIRLGNTAGDTHRR